jgi:hypothetical protein
MVSHREGGLYEEAWVILYLVMAGLTTRAPPKKHLFAYLLAYLVSNLNHNIPLKKGFIILKRT